MYKVMSASEARKGGLRDEQRVIQALRDRGNTVQEASKHDNIVNDIDCWVNGIPVSIKAQHKGLIYGNIYVELASQFRTHVDCPVTNKMMASLKHDNLSGDEVEERVNILVDCGSWTRRWWYNGTAELYAILQGNTIRVYRKSHIVKFVDRKGWRKLRTLSKAVRDRELEGGGKFVNSLTAYLNIIDVPHQDIVLF